MSRTVFEVKTFLQQHVFRSPGALEHKLSSRRLHDPISALPAVQIENLPQVMLFQGTKDHDLVDPIHELR